MRKAVFLERDGILNLVRVERQQQVAPTTVEEFHVNHDALHDLERLKAAGFLLIATTNQPGLSHGGLYRRELDLMHDKLRRTFALDDVLVCPHTEADMCPCHKPRPGLLTEAAFNWQLDLDGCFVVSDKWQDAAAARTVGCTSLLIKSPWIAAVHRDLALPSLSIVVDRILQISSPGRILAA